jgi:hypothetical protein
MRSLVEVGASARRRRQRLLELALRAAADVWRAQQLMPPPPQPPQVQAQPQTPQQPQALPRAAGGF